MEGMMSILFLIVSCTVLESSVIRQYHFIEHKKDWYSAQAYCREHYIDLAYVNSRSDHKKLRKSGGEKPKGWMGLNRDPNETEWRWSGGGLITYKKWGDNQPDDKYMNETKGYLSVNGGWKDSKSSHEKPFYCVSLPPVEQSRKTWEEALSHCRENRSDLVSLRSDTELLFTQTLITRAATERVWIGLRYLGDRWLWVNGDDLGFQAWPAGREEERQCPALNRCGALPKEGAWESVDCQERLHFICN